LNLKEDANFLAKHLISKGIKAVGVHGNLEYQQRAKNLKAFRAKSQKVLIATDVIARGIDIKNLPLVVNYDLPESTDDFTHRSGRTGRAGVSGNVISFLTVNDYNHFTKIERNLKLNIKRTIKSGFELDDRQPRQKQMKKKKLSILKGKKERRVRPIRPAVQSKKTTKRDR
jgi:ATP-dependent RNA helicase RhlE